MTQIIVSKPDGTAQFPFRSGLSEAEAEEIAEQLNREDPDRTYYTMPES